jgi:hypothetical protein
MKSNKEYRNNYEKVGFISGEFYKEERFMKISNCCGVQGFVKVFDNRLSGENYYDSELYGICPKCGEHCQYVLVDDVRPWVNDNDLGGTGHGDISYSDADPGL